MGLAVDPAREAAHNNEPRSGELAPQATRDLRAVRRTRRAPTIELDLNNPPEMELPQLLSVARAAARKGSTSAIV